MLVSLKEEKAKKLAQVISNPTCTKILDHIAKKGSDTESEIAKTLKIPLSTVHYNLKQLVGAKLVLAEEYTYSKKGREILHYKLANKYIIIAPEEEKEDFMEKLKHFLPITLITLGAAAILKLLGLLNGNELQVLERSESAASLPAARSILADASVVEKSLPEAASMLADFAPAQEMVKSAANETVNDTMRVITEHIVVIKELPLLSNHLIIGFLFGAFFVIAFLLFWSHFSRRNA